LAKQKYSDQNGENVVHMYTPFSYDIGKNYNYRRSGALGSLFFYFLHSLILVILYPYFLFVNGLKIVGRENMRAMRGKGVVTVSNHVHIMDSPMLSCAIGFRRTYYVAAASNFCIPLVRHFVRGLGGVPITAAPSQMKYLFSEMNAALAGGKAVQMYPESVLMPYCDTLRAFKRGAFYMAAEADVPVLPMVFTFRKPRGLLGRIRKKPFVTLRILPAIYPDSNLKKEQKSIRLRDACFTAMSAVSENVGKEEEKESA